MTLEDFENMGYEYLRVLPDGRVCGLLPFMLTYGLIVGIDHIGYDHRFCYPDKASAVKALEKWDGKGDPSGPWIKQKGGVERCNPGLSGIPIVIDNNPVQESPE